MELSANFPATTWNGLSQNDLRPDLTHNVNPNFQDWDRIVAEVMALEVSQNATVSVVDSSLTAGTVPGQLVAYKAAGTVSLADQATAGPAHAVGIALTTSAKSTAVTYQYAGPVTLPTAEWDAAAGTSGGLTAGTLYYVGATGALTATKTGTSGHSIVEVGVAMTTTTLMLNIHFLATN